MTTDTGTYFKDLFHHFGFVCIAMDRDLVIRHWNEQAIIQFGERFDDLEGVSFLDVLNPPDRDAARRALEETIEALVSLEMEIRFKDEDGSKVTYVLITSPIVNEQGESVGATASMRDISQRKRLAQDVATSRRMAALGRMAGGVAHHFNNILGGMLTSIDYVLTSDSPRELRRTLRMLAN